MNKTTSAGQSFLGVLLILLAFSGQVTSQIQIAEIDAFGELEDGLGRGEDWIELVNVGETAASLGGLYLSDDAQNWGQWSLPNITLDPQERLVVWCSGRDVGAIDHWECPADDTDAWHYWVPNQALDADWRTLDFDDSNWQTGPGSIGYGDGDDAITINGNVVFMRRNFNGVNTQELVHGVLAMDYDDGFVAFLNGREFARSSTMEGASVAHNALTGGLHEAVLYTGGIPESVPFDPREWLVEGANVLAVQVHNDNVNSSDLTARPFLALARTDPTPVPFGILPNWLEPEAPEFHTNFKLKPGEPVILSNAAGDLLDLATLPSELRSGVTMGRAEGASEWCFFTSPSPGTANLSSCFSHIAPAPVVEPSSGWYTASAVSAVPGVPSGPPGQTLPAVTLRFTADGSEPTASSAAFTGFWNPAETSVLSVKAFGEGMVPSATVDRIYFMDEPSTGLQKVSLFTHPDHLWDWNTGIYVSGPNAGPDYPFFGSNFWEPWSRESRLTWFDADGDPVAEARLDLEIHGGWSRAEPQRSFRLDFKKRYSGPLEHAVFSSKPDIEKFGNLNLRNGGQASWENKFQDAFYGELALETNVVASGWRPVEVYLNGEYWGVYGAREKADEQFVEDNFGWDDNAVDLVSAFASLNGGPSAFEATVNPLLQLPDGSEAFHTAFAEKFDVASYIDYHIFEIHGQNVDWIAAPWGQNNVKFFRANTGDGLWRPMLYDTDACFGAWGTSPYDNYLALTLNPPYDSQFTDLFRKVLEDDEYQCQFATRTCDLLETSFSAEVFDARLSMTAANMAAAMAHHIELWDSPASLSYWQQRVEYMRSHNETRASPERIHVRDEFGYSDTELLTVSWSPPFAGEVTVNEMDNLSTGWNGEYFGECPIRIAAIPYLGFGFLGWQNNLHIDMGLVDANDPFVEVSLQEDDQFFAIFGPCLDGVELSIQATDDGLQAAATGSDEPLEFEWYLDGILVGEGSGLAPPVPGGYVLTATDGTCTLISDALTWPVSAGDEVVHVSEPVTLDAPLNLSVSPNPVASAAIVTGAGEGDLTVTDAAGRTVFVAQNARLPFVLDAGLWAPGVYAVRLSSATGQQFTRLVKR